MIIIVGLSLTGWVGQVLLAGVLIAGVKLATIAYEATINN